MQKFVAQTAQSLKDFTDSAYPQGSFAFSRLLRDRDIRVNGEKTGKNIDLSPGDEVCYYTTAKEESRPFYSIVYEDENILVADKFAGVNSEALAASLAKERGARFIHRLDRNTAGLIVFALNAAAERELLAAFRERRAEKIYEAVCFFPFEKESGSLTAYLVKDERAARVRVYGSPRAGADKIATDYRVKTACGEYSLAEIRIHGGKTHQIRAHMAYIGHPLAGDEKYGCEPLNRKYRVKRHILVAKRLSFRFSGPLSYLNGKTFESSFSAQMPQFSDFSKKVSPNG